MQNKNITKLASLAPIILFNYFTFFIVFFLNTSSLFLHVKIMARWFTCYCFTTTTAFLGVISKATLYSFVLILRIFYIYLCLISNNLLFMSETSLILISFLMKMHRCVLLRTYEGLSPADVSQIERLFSHSTHKFSHGQMILHELIPLPSINAVASLRRQ